MDFFLTKRGKAGKIVYSRQIENDYYIKMNRMKKTLDIQPEINPELKIGTLRLAGDITADSDTAIIREFDKFMAEKLLRIIFDFEAVTYINSAGMAILLELINRITATTCVVQFRNLSPHLQKLFEMLGLSDFVLID